MCPSPEATVGSGHRLPGTAPMRRGLEVDIVAGAGDRHDGQDPPRISRRKRGAPSRPREEPFYICRCRIVHTPSPVT
jgi:hypothetical protein